MKYNSKRKITSLPSSKNTKEKTRKSAALSNHKNASNNNTLSESSTSTGNRFKNIKIPFSTYIKIDYFHQQPIFNHTAQHTLNFKDQTGLLPDSETFQLNTSTYYHEQPYGRMVSSNVHAMMDLNKEASKISIEKSNYQHAITKSLKQNTNLQEMDDIFTTVFPFGKFLVPIVLGEYNIGILLKENTLFDKGIIRILEVPTEVILTKCKFIPSNFTDSSYEEKRTVSNGVLFVEGFIQESMEYLPAINWEKLPPREWLKSIYYRVDQKIMLDLRIQLLQLVQFENHHQN